MKTRSWLRTKLSQASTKRSGCLLLSKQTKHKQKQKHKVSTPKVPSQRRSTHLEPNFHKGGLSVDTKTVISLRIKDIISGCVRVGSGPLGGGGREGARRPLGQCHFPMLWSVVPSYRCKRNVGGKVVVARHWSSTFHLRQSRRWCLKTRRRRGQRPGGPRIYLGAWRSERGSQEQGG